MCAFVYLRSEFVPVIQRSSIIACVRWPRFKNAFIKHMPLFSDILNRLNVLISRVEISVRRILEYPLLRVRYNQTCVTRMCTHVIFNLFIVDKERLIHSKFYYTRLRNAVLFINLYFSEECYI